MKLKQIDKNIIKFFEKRFLLLARLAFFVVFFWFGIIKLLGISPAGDLARVLVDKTVGLTYFDELFVLLALIEVLIGILFLIPKAVRVTIPLLFVHLLIVSTPLLLVPEFTWDKPFVPTLEGQYILKNIALVALAFAVASNTKPLSLKR